MRGPASNAVGRSDRNSIMTKMISVIIPPSQSANVIVTTRERILDMASFSDLSIKSLARARRGGAAWRRDHFALRRQCKSSDASVSGRTRIQQYTIGTFWIDCAADLSAVLDQQDVRRISIARRDHR